ncbi:hypothetical protein HK105_205530 [Polyrhizophydium stewartii]|uniref:G-protein coupled receptors family 1 profile domain-containing protein n=1 Tax=Polyrhizophydium stewartii TaxID=2732419 RepID=A0ABR4N687_9FUNG
MTLSADQLVVVTALARFASLLSFAGVAVIIMYFVAQPHWFGNIMGRLVLALTLTDLLGAAAKVVSRAGPEAGTWSALCQAQGAMIQYSNLASMFLSLVIAVNMLFIVFVGGSVHVLQSHMPMIIAVCFALPVPITAALFLIKPEGTYNLIGGSDLWCWISSSYRSYQISLFVGWLWVIFAFEVIAYVLTWSSLRRLAKSTQHMRAWPSHLSMHKVNAIMSRRMLAYTLAFLLVWTPQSLNRILSLFWGQNVYPLTVAHAIMSPLRGFVNCMAFLYTQLVIDARLDTESGPRTPNAHPESQHVLLESPPNSAGSSWASPLASPLVPLPAPAAVRAGRSREPSAASQHADGQLHLGERSQVGTESVPGVTRQSIPHFPPQPLMPLSPSQQAITTVLVLTSSVLSFVGVGVLVLAWAARPKWFDSLIGRLVLALAAADLISAAAKIIGRAGPDAGADSQLCQLQAALIQVGNVFSVLISLVIAVNMLLIVFAREGMYFVQRFEAVIVAGCLAVSIGLGIAPLVIQPDGKHNLVGEGTLWCWISSAYPLYQAGLFYAILWTIFLLDIIAYLSVWASIRRLQDRVERSRITTEVLLLRKYNRIMTRRMQAYSLSFVLVWLPSTLSRISDMASAETSFGLAAAHAFVSPLRGMINCIVFLYIQGLVDPKSGADASDTISDVESSVLAGTLAPCAAAQANRTSRRGFESLQDEVELEARGGAMPPMSPASPATPASPLSLVPPVKRVQFASTVADSPTRSSLHRHRRDTSSDIDIDAISRLAESGLTSQLALEPEMCESAPDSASSEGSARPQQQHQQQQQQRERERHRLPSLTIPARATTVSRRISQRPRMQPSPSPTPSPSPSPRPSSTQEPRRR